MIWFLIVATITAALCAVTPDIVRIRKKQLSELPMMSRLMAAAVADTQNRRWKR